MTLLVIAGVLITCLLIGSAAAKPVRDSYLNITLSDPSFSLGIAEFDTAIAENIKNFHPRAEPAIDLSDPSVTLFVRGFAPNGTPIIMTPLVPNLAFGLAPFATQPSFTGRGFMVLPGYLPETPFFIPA